MADQQIDQVVAPSSSAARVEDAQDKQYQQWKQDIKSYEQQKKNFQGESVPYKKVTHAFIKAQDTLYNPITQRFANTNVEETAKTQEQERMMNVLAQNKDRQLRYEQIYNVINFENKLKGLESRPDYPKEKPWYFRPDPDSKANYNILSNLPLDVHHFDAPEKRPKPQAEDASNKDNQEKKRRENRDYDIISNKYLQFHDEKMLANEDILRKEAAKKYWSVREYDPVVGQLYDEEKEKEFVKERDDKAAVHGKDQVKKLPAIVQQDGLMYNPINNEVEDELRLQERQTREKNAKKRYETKYQAEAKVQYESQEDQLKKDVMSLRKVNNKRFTSDQERGFDMISNQVAVAHKTDYDTHFNKLVEKPSSLWTKVEKERNSQALNAAAATMVPSNKDQILQKHQEFFGQKGETSLLSKTCLGARKDRVEKRSVQPVSRSSKAVSSGRGAIRTGGFQRIAADIVAN